MSGDTLLNSTNMVVLLKVLYGVFVLAVFLPFCLSAVENCRPCGHGEYCSKFFGICLACKDYCPGDADCPSACPPIEPSLTTIAPTTTEPTSTQSITTNVASDVVVQQSTNANIISEGDITFSDNGKDDSELPAWLSVGMLVTLVIIVLLIVVCRKYCKTLKMPSLCCFSSGDSSNRTSIRDTGMTIWTNPMPNQPAEYHQTTGGYTAVQVDDVDGPNTMDQPGPSSQQNSSRPSRPPGPNVEAPADPPHSASGSRNYTSSASTTPGPTSIQIHDTSPSTSGVSAVVVQSASIHPTVNLESESPRGACPSDQRSSGRRTPDTHRKIADGTHEGHEFSIGTSALEDIQLYHHPAHGD
eukprot:XP_011671340.1 PREDICTED: mucin-5AC [Strongylocentrotus purpuratus]